MRPAQVLLNAFYKKYRHAKGHKDPEHNYTSAIIPFILQCFIMKIARNICYETVQIDSAQGYAHHAYII
jgi:hypothetical protein